MENKAEATFSTVQFVSQEKDHRAGLRSYIQVVMPLGFEPKCLDSGLCFLYHTFWEENFTKNLTEVEVLECRKDNLSPQQKYTNKGQ